MNNQRDIYTPPHGPPQGNRLSPEIYSVMGEENIYLMLEDFYRALATSSIRELFPAESEEAMRVASRRSADFFIFLMGGPPLYHQKHGPPMMRKRHLVFEITESARTIWVETFLGVLKGAENRYRFPAQHLDSFITFLNEFSAWMVNSRA